MNPNSACQTVLLCWAIVRSPAMSPCCAVLCCAVLWPPHPSLMMSQCCQQHVVHATVCCCWLVVVCSLRAATAADSVDRTWTWSRYTQPATHIATLTCGAKSRHKT